MARRIVVIVTLLVIGYLLYANRHHISFVAGLDSNRIRIKGEWQEVVHGFKETDVFLFSEGIIRRNEDNSYGSYYFTSHAQLVVTTGGGPVTYTVEFPDEETMNWYREIKGEMKPVKKWAR